MIPPSQPSPPPVTDSTPSSSLFDQASQNGQIEVKDDGTVLNEEGLPFLEIRESLDASSSSSSSSLDKPTTIHSGFASGIIASTTLPKPTARIEEIHDVSEDDHWSSEAVERRRRFRERLFAGSDEEEEEEEEEEEDSEEEDGDYEDDDDEFEDDNDGRQGDLKEEERSYERRAQLEAHKRARSAENANTQERKSSSVASHSVGITPTSSTSPLSTKPATREFVSPTAFSSSFIPLAPHTPKMTSASASEMRTSDNTLSSPSQPQVQTHASSKTKTKPKPGFMLRSTVVDHSQAKEAPESQPETESAAVPEDTVEIPSSTRTIRSGSVPVPGVKPILKGVVSQSRSQPKPARSDIGAADVARYEDAPAQRENQKDFQNTGKRSVAFASHAAVRRFDKENQIVAKKPVTDNAAEQKDVTGSMASLSVSDSPGNTTTKISADFGSGLKRGFLNNSGAKSQSQAKTPTATPAPRPVSYASAVATAPKPTPIETDSLEPIAPPHEPTPTPKNDKKMSLFAQRKVDKAAARSGARGGANGLVRSMSNSASGAMKGSVVERSAVVVPAVPAKIIPIPEKEDIPTLDEYSEDEHDDFGGDDETPEFYSDTEEDAFDMTDAMLAREAAMAYHQKRAELGRRGLGGWTGTVKHREGARASPSAIDGEVDSDAEDYGFDPDEWDGEIVPMDSGMESGSVKRGPVAFGERIVPRAFQNQNEPSSISLPHVVPGHEDLGAAIKIGKLENGNLIVRDEDDSDAEEGEGAENRKRMLERLTKEDPADLIREEREKEDSIRILDDRPRADNRPPEVGPPQPLPPQTHQKKVSKFKAARMAAVNSNGGA